MSENYRPISEVSRKFEMSQVWLHQLRIAGNVTTVVIKSPTGKQLIYYDIDEVGKWINDHPVDYDNRKKMGDYRRVTGYRGNNKTQ